MKAKLFRAIAFLSVLIVFLTSLSPLPVFAVTVYHALDPGWVEVYSENFDEGFGGWSPLGIPANSLPLLSEGGRGRQEREPISGDNSPLESMNRLSPSCFSCKVQIECQRHDSLFRVQD